MTLTPEEQAEALVFLDLAIAENERLRASVERLAEAVKWAYDYFEDRGFSSHRFPLGNALADTAAVGALREKA